MLTVNWSELVEIFRTSLNITGLVIIMMLVIEYFNVTTHGRKFTSLRQSPFKQVLIGAALGLIPGCTGGFAAVSLYSHSIIGCGGLLAAMISDTGDETFLMFAAMPKEAIFIKLMTFALAVGMGLIVNMFFAKNKSASYNCGDHELEIHDKCDAREKSRSNIGHNIRHLSRARVVVLSAIFLFILALGFGLLEHSHEAHEHGVALQECGHEHFCEHEHDLHGNIFSERWINILFLFVAAAAFAMVLSVSEHFFKEHIVKHIIRKHVLRVFIWTFGSLTFIYLLGLFVHYDSWIDENQIIMLLIALTIGLIPQSGPHIIFISLFIHGNIPFSILLANSVVQSGHSGLPLLAETKKGFINTKMFALIAGLVVGLLGYFLGW